MTDVATDLTPEDLRAARELLEGVAVLTPMEESRWLSALAGGPESLTIAHLENETDWVDVQDAGLRVTSGKNQLSVDTDELGTFSLAVP